MPTLDGGRGGDGDSEFSAAASYFIVKARSLRDRGEGASRFPLEIDHHKWESIANREKR